LRQKLNMARKKKASKKRTALTKAKRAKRVAGAKARRTRVYFKKKNGRSGGYSGPLAKDADGDE
jgi:hypothetical protein